MNIHEYQAAELLARYGIPTNPGTVATTPDEVEQAAGKGQRRSGRQGPGAFRRSRQGRRRQAGEVPGGSPGGRRADPGHGYSRAHRPQGTGGAGRLYCARVLSRCCAGPAEPQAGRDGLGRGRSRDRDRREGKPGKDQNAPTSIRFSGCIPTRREQLGFELGHRGGQSRWICATSCRSSPKLYQELDATLAEINPLILTEEGNWLALDSKVSFDDNALFRHPDSKRCVT